MPHSHHSHSGQFCRHAKDQLEDIVKEAIKQGFEVYGLTEHAPRYRLEDLYPEESDMTINDLKRTYINFLSTAAHLKAKYADKITLLIGLESDLITPQDLEETLNLFNSRTEIDYIVGSVHHVNGIPIDFDRDTWLSAVHFANTGAVGSMMESDPDSAGPSGSQLIRPGRSDSTIPQLQPGYTPTMDELRTFILAYLDAQYAMIQTLQPEIVGHFDLFRLWTPDMDVFDMDRNQSTKASGRGVRDMVERNIDAVVAYGGLFELNTAAFRKGWDTAYPSRGIAKVIIGKGGQFCFSDDSHGTAQVGLNYHRLRGYCSSLGIKSVSYLRPGSQGNLRDADEEADLRRARRCRVAIKNLDKVLEHPFWTLNSGDKST